MRLAGILDKGTLKMAKNGIIVCTLIWLAASSAVASPETFYSEKLPSGVVLGMTLDQLAQVRPEARKNDLIQSQNTDDESVAMVEILRQGNAGTAFWYRFKNGKLGAVSRSVSTKNLSSESAQASAGQTYDELRENFNLLRQEEVLRSTGAATFQVSAQLWEDKAKGLNIYFVASSQENTVIIFDPATFSSRDFFVPVDKRGEIDAQAKSVRDILGKSAPTPPPVVDFLPEVTKEAASKAPTPSPTAAPTTPVPPTTTPVQQPQSTAPATPSPTAAQTQSSRGFPIVPLAIGGAVIVGIVLYLLRRKSP